MLIEIKQRRIKPEIQKENKTAGLAGRSPNIFDEKTLAGNHDHDQDKQQVQDARENVRLQETGCEKHGRRPIG